MEQKLSMPNSKGKFATSKKAVGLTVIGLVCAAGVLYLVKHKQPKSQSQTPIIQKEVKYVFFSAEGKPVTLSEQDVFDVKQKYEDGVLPTIIADEYDMNAVMVCRIVNSIKSL